MPGVSTATRSSGAPADLRIIGLESRRVDAASIGDPDADVRAGALGTVLSHPESATPLGDALAARLADPRETEDNRILAAHALGKVRPLPVASLVVGLERRQGAPVRAASASALIAGPGEAAGASRPLARCLLAGDATVRFQSVMALRGIGGPAVGDIVAVIEESEKFDITRMSGLDALGFIGGEAEAGLPLAQRLADDAPVAVTVCARFAMASIKGAGAKDGSAGDSARGKAAKPLLEMIRHDEEPVRLLAIERVGWLKHGLPSAGETFVELLKGGSPKEREMAALGLARSRTPTDVAVEPLVAALGDPEAGVRKAACIALSAYGMDAKPALDPMLKLVKDSAQPDEVRRSAGECAKAIVKAQKGPYWT